MILRNNACIIRRPMLCPEIQSLQKNKLIIKFAPYMLYCSGKHSIINMIPNAVNPISIKKLAIRFIH